MSSTICQTLYMTSLALGTFNRISVELSTPGVGVDNGLAICFMGAQYNLTHHSTSVRHSLGGHQFEAQSEAPLSSAESNIVTFSSVLQQDHTFTSRENLRKFHHNWGPPSEHAARLPEILFRHDLSAPAKMQCGQSGVAWLACPSQCFNISGSFERNTRHHFILTVVNPSAPGPSAAPLPTIWVAPLKHSQANGTVQTTITGQSKAGAVCSKPVLHSASNAAQHQLFDACELANELRVYVGDHSLPGPCIAALQAHAQSLLATADALPLELQAPPLVSPWPPNSTVSSDCPVGSVASAHAGRGCVSCAGGAVNFPLTGEQECVCGPASVRLPVGPRACSDAVYAGSRSVSSLAELPGELCAFFKQEFNSMVLGELATEVVAAEYGLALLQLAWPLLDVDTYTRLQAAYYPDMLFDVRHPDVPTRERGVWGICSTCTPEGRFIEGRSKQWATTHDWRFQAAHVFRFIGFVLHELGSECRDLYDPGSPRKLHYGPYDAVPCAQLPDASSHLLHV